VITWSIGAAALLVVAELLLDVVAGRPA
jgi:hypothetical protein